MCAKVKSWKRARVWLESIELNVTEKHSQKYLWSWYPAVYRYFFYRPKPTHHYPLTTSCWWCFTWHDATLSFVMHVVCITSKKSFRTKKLSPQIHWSDSLQHPNHLTAGRPPIVLSPPARSPLMLVACTTIRRYHQWHVYTTCINKRKAPQPKL